MPRPSTAKSPVTSTSRYYGLLSEIRDLNHRAGLLQGSMMDAKRRNCHLEARSYQTLSDDLQNKADLMVARLRASGLYVPDSLNPEELEPGHLRTPCQTT